MAREFSRADRLAEQIQREVGAVLLFDIDNPQLKGLTVSGVDVSRDLAYAKIFITRPDWSVSDGRGSMRVRSDASGADANASDGARTAPERGADSDRGRRSAAHAAPEDGEVLAELGRAAGYLRRTLATRLRVRAVPALRFEIDKTLDQAARIERLLAES